MILLYVVSETPKTHILVNLNLYFVNIRNAYCLKYRLR